MNLQEEREKSRRYELARMFAKVIAKKDDLAELDKNAYWISKKSVELADALIAALKEDAK